MAAETIYRVCVSRGRYQVVEYTVYDSGHERAGEIVYESTSEPDAQAECDNRNMEQYCEATNYPTG